MKVNFILDAAALRKFIDNWALEDHALGQIEENLGIVGEWGMRGQPAIAIADGRVRIEIELSPIEDPDDLDDGRDDEDDDEEEGERCLVSG